ncbi:GDSL esterase/lipase At2g04570-like [Phalaenopsis equestris]|uniref:GDSL esterase/lipase At2g04570-like n=1 Tax=Phalaenopsis equestris TaxID=78828 RepID=UPI0009E5DFFC|nr:GDSL esterase/lipase At2g04570-like [Phalaenopsis equestris]
MQQRCLGVLCLLHLLLLRSCAGKVPVIIVFGDSTVDSGNNNFINTVVKSNYAPYGRDFDGGKATGRFSNGRLATDFISQAFNLSPTVPPYLDPSYAIKDFAHAVCFASAASGYDYATSNVASAIPLWKQLEYFKDYIGKLRSYQGEAKATETIREGLYIISMGTNDFLENYYAVPGRSSTFTVDEYQNFLIGIAGRFVEEIYALGARKIDLTGLPPMGCLPLERSINFPPSLSDECKQDYNRVARDFNSKLNILMDKLDKEKPDISLVYSNIYDFFDAVLKSPSSYGFEVAEVGCCGASGRLEMGYFCKFPLTCKDASKYVFWDSMHPTQKMNKLIADYIVNTTLARFM